MVDPGARDVEDEAAVGEPRQVGVDDRVQLADRRGREADVDLLAGRDDLHPLGHRGVRVGDLGAHRLDGEDRRVGGAQVADVEVVDVLVGDQHRGRAVDGLPLGERRPGR